MKERPILFSGEMVRAILDGRKTQTRRTVRGSENAARFVHGVAGEGEDWWHYFPEPRGSAVNIRCPYGQPGDRLWVRETWADAGGFQRDCFYRADYPDRKPNEVAGWRPSSRMPRCVSRLTLEVTDVRVERLQEISEEDAEAEGVKTTFAFRELWDSINAKKAPWESNPWVWVVEFKEFPGSTGRAG